MPKTNELEGFQYDTSLDLSMVYYNIQLINNTSNLCTIIPPRGKYCYKHIQMGVSNSPDILQQKSMIYFIDLNLSVHT